ncbi:O-antigen ligase family protein [Sphingomonas sp. M1A8_2b]
MRSPAMQRGAPRRTAPAEVARTPALGHRPRFALAQIEVVLGIVAVLAMAGTLLAGTAGAAIFLVSAIALMALNPARSARDLARFAPLLVFPLLAMISTIWSDAPERTLRAAIQLMLTVMTAIIVCRRVSGPTLIAVLFAAYAAMCLASLVELPAAISRRVPMTGLFDSKNQFAFVAHLLFALGLAVLADRRQNALLRIGALATIPLSLVLVALAQSAGAGTSVAVTLVTFPAVLVLGRVRPSLRIAIVVGMVLMVVLALAFLPDILAAWTDFQVHVLKKDATLTGRTYLWDFAARITAERPLLGHGYYAFWRVGNIDAEGLWRWGGIANRSGFNFHNIFVEMKVDLGWVGAILFLITCAGIAAAGLVRQLTKATVPVAFLLSLLIVLYIRSYAESTLIGPFNMLTFLWVAAGVYACSGLGDRSPPIARTLPRGGWIERRL